MRIYLGRLSQISSVKAHSAPTLALGPDPCPSAGSRAESPGDLLGPGGVAWRGGGGGYLVRGAGKSELCAKRSLPQTSLWR